MRSWQTVDHLERVRAAALVVTAGSAALTVLGGLTVKSTTAWSNYPNGTGESWTDGVKPWALWAVLGGIAVLALLTAGLAWGERW